MNKLQSNLYKLLTEIDDICKKYDIQYFLAGGTALGTVRNHCFLPWDDDIDLYITRDNWNKLRYVVENEENVLPEGRSLIYMENTPYYNNPIPRYVDNTTTSIMYSQVLPAKACGQHIEMLIMDPIPNDEKEREEFIELMKVYTELISPYFVVCKNLSLEDWDKHHKLYKHYQKRIRRVGEEKVMKELDEKLHSYATEDCDTFCMRWGIDILLYKKEYYGKGRLEKFEDGYFPVGENAEGIFRVAYGDSWMYVPDFEEQVVHESFQDLDIPFSNYTEKYLPKIDRPSVFKKYKINKRSNADVFYARRKIEKIAAKLNVDMNAPDIVDLLNSKEEYLRGLLLDKKYDELTKEFAEYKALQFKPDVKKFNVIVPLSDRNLCTLLLNSIEQGRYYEANKYLKIRKMISKPFSDELLQVEEIMNACRELSVAKYDLKDHKLVSRLLKEYELKYPNLLDVFRAKLFVLESSDKPNYGEIVDLCNQILEFYPFDGETMAVLAHATAALGQMDEALSWCKKAIDNTRNGLVWDRMYKEFGISRIDIEREMIEVH